MNEINIEIKTLPHFEGLPLPKYQTEGASGIDLLAAGAAMCFVAIKLAL